MLWRLTGNLARHEGGVHPYLESVDNVYSRVFPPEPGLGLRLELDEPRFAIGASSGHR